MQKYLDDISTGKRYTISDMVRASCNDCAGCSSCCEDMGDSILLDPLDLYQLTGHLHRTFEQLMDQSIELHVVDGMILPNLKMSAETNACPFLNEQGRCSIHSFRPGICRVFPLGRIYEDGKLDYFMQAEGCVKQERSKSWKMVRYARFETEPEIPDRLACVPQEDRRNPRCHGR